MVDRTPYQPEFRPSEELEGDTGAALGEVRADVEGRSEVEGAVQTGERDDESTIDALAEGFDMSEIAAVFSNLSESLSEFFEGIMEKFNLSMGDIAGIEEVDEDNVEETADALQSAIVESNREAIPELRHVAMERTLNGIEGIDYSINSFRGLGGRPASVVTHDDFDPSRPYKLIYHFHGTHGEDPDNNDRFARTMGTFAEETDPQTVIVYGLSSPERAQESERYQYDSEWPEDMALFHEEVLSVMEHRFSAPAANAEKVILEGHSAGGRALQNCAEQGFPADSYVFLDATYGNWGEDTYDALDDLAPEYDPDIQIFLSTDATEEHAQSIIGREGVRVVSGIDSHALAINEGLGGMDNS